jgi:molybdenum cofactor guanylyltransferase
MSHGELFRKKMGLHAHRELAFLGASCEYMREVADRLRKILSTYDIGYLDGAHGDVQVASSDFVGHDFGFQTQHNMPWEKFDAAIQTNHLDALIINGHHYPSQVQLLFCDEKKAGTLDRRKEQLTGIMAVYVDGNSELPVHIQTLIEHRTGVVILRSVEELAMWFQKMFLSPPLLEGLILVGGKSERMGTDKSMIEHHGIPQWKYLAMCMEDVGMKVNLSCRAEQAEQYQRDGLTIIADRINGAGPLGGIVSAFMRNAHTAYLTVACDMPNIDSKAMIELVQHRNPTKFATCFVNEEKQWPEPLFTIWEPKSYMRMMEFIALGYSCPRKILMNSSVKKVVPNDHSVLNNVNTPEDLKI